MATLTDQRSLAAPTLPFQLRLLRAEWPVFSKSVGLWYTSSSPPPALT